MRKFFICPMLLLITASCASQQLDSSQILPPNYYLQKSKNQKRTAWVLLGGGFAVAVGSAALDVNSDWSKSETGYLVGFATGCASMLGSIPLFVASSRNKRKGMNVSSYFEIRQNRVLTNKGLTAHSTPTVSLKLNF